MNINTLDRGEKFSEWQVPAYEAAGTYKKGWLDELVQNGDRFIQSQPGTRNINDDIKLVIGLDQDNSLKSNSFQSDFRTFVETVTDLRQIATLGASAEQIKKNVALYNDILKYIFWDSGFLFAYRYALQYALMGRGYIWTKFSRDHYGWGKGRMTFDALGPLEVLPEQLPANNDVQGSYAVTIIRAMPIAEAHARFPQFQDQLQPIARYEWSKYNTRGGIRLDFWDRARFQGEQDWDRRYCVPLDSEILTRLGWKKYSEVSIGDEVMGYNPNSQKCEWTKLLDITIKKNQEVYSYKSKSFKVRCTKDHRWIIKKRALAKTRRKENIFYNNHVEFSTLDDCDTTSILIQSAPAPDGPGLSEMKSEAYMVRGDAVKMVLQMTSGERRAFITGMLYGEGSCQKPKNAKQRGTTVFAQKPGPVYDAMKLACALEGIATNQGYYCNPDTSETKVFTLRHVPHKRIEELKPELTTTEDVWCPTTGLGTWVMRQGDLITITGNCEMRYSFIRDLRVNDTGRTIQMGVPGSTWGYEVPSMGDLLVSTNPYNGLPESRAATEEDCLVYPQLRLMISNPTVKEPLYDNTAFDWDGEIPVAQLDVNDFVWSPLGYSVVRNVAGLVKAQRAGTSRIDEVLAIRKDPPTGYDLSTGVSRTQMEKIDLLTAQGVRVGLKGDPKKAVVSILPDSITVDSEDWKGQEYMEGQIKASLGLTDIASMRDLKMNLSDQSFEKAITNLGPIGKGIALNTWKCNGKIAQRLKYLIPQYIPVAELVKMVGPEGVGLETFDNDPNSLIPGRLPGEDEKSDSKFSKRQRAQWFVEQLNVVSTPAQLLNITHTQERMLYMFFLQKGVPISMATTMEKLGVEGYEVEYEKWKTEKLAQAEWELEVKATLAKKAKELGFEEPPPPDKPGQGHGGGRPGTSQKMPHASVKGSKSGDVRAVNKQSK